jgi:hypothetical protein
VFCTVICGALETLDSLVSAPVKRVKSAAEISFDLASITRNGASGLSIILSGRSADFSTFVIKVLFSSIERWLAILTVSISPATDKKNTNPRDKKTTLVFVEKM